MVKRSVERVANSEVHGDLEEIVLEHDEPGVHERRVAEEALEDVELLRRRDRAGGDVPVCISGPVSSFVHAKSTTGTHRWCRRDRRGRWSR